MLISMMVIITDIYIVMVVVNVFINAVKVYHIIQRKINSHAINIIPVLNKIIIDNMKMNKIVSAYKIVVKTMLPLRIKLIIIVQKRHHVIILQNLIKTNTNINIEYKIIIQISV